jgi:hypothetical protein
MLVDLRGEKSHVEYEPVLPGSPENFKFRATGKISADYAREVAKEVAKGQPAPRRSS